MPNRTFKVLLFSASLMTAVPLPSRASLIAVMTSGIPVNTARMTTPKMVLFSFHASLKNTADRTIPMQVTMMTISAAPPIHAQDQESGVVAIAAGWREW